MCLGDAPNLRIVIKTAKPDYIKLVHQFIFGNDKNWQNQENLCKFAGFKLKIYDEDSKLTGVPEKFNKIRLIQIAYFLQIDLKETKRNCV